MAPPPAEDPEELVDYDDEAEEPYVAPTTVAATAGAENGDADKKGSYVGIHSTGFRDFLLKPEILRAISDLGFEHPSEGSCRALPLRNIADASSPAGVHPPGHPWYRRSLSSQVWYG